MKTQQKTYKCITCGKECLGISCDTCQAASLVEWEILRLQMRRDMQEWGVFTLKFIQRMRDEKIFNPHQLTHFAKERDYPQMVKCGIACKTAGTGGNPDPSYFAKGITRAEAIAKEMKEGNDPFWRGMTDGQVTQFNAMFEKIAERNKDLVA